VAFVRGGKPLGNKVLIDCSRDYLQDRPRAMARVFGYGNTTFWELHKANLPVYGHCALRPLPLKRATVLRRNPTTRPALPLLTARVLLLTTFWEL
jgi:hypothetical protein